MESTDALKALLAGQQLKPEELEKLYAEIASRHQLINERTELLRGRYKILQKQHDFSPGQLVKWKDGLKNKKRPNYGEPAIVVEVLQNPILDQERDSGSAYYREPLDIILGIIDEDGGFIMYHFDKRRFEPFESNK